jgi:hypothetical protein
MVLMNNKDVEFVGTETLTGLNYVPNIRGITPMHIGLVGAPAFPLLIFSFVINAWASVMLLILIAFVFTIVLQWGREPRYWLRAFRRGALPPYVYRLCSKLFQIQLTHTRDVLSPFEKEPIAKHAMVMPYLDVRSQENGP